MAASSALPPSTEGPLSTFITVQFRTKCIPPPASTNFSGMTAVVTGSNCGIGLETSAFMLELNLSHIILAVRSVDKGEKAAAPLRAKHPKAKIEVWPLDMCSYDSIQAFVKRCASLPRLDMAILNAGLGGVLFNINPSTGHEETFQVNYLSTALLSILLLPVLKPKKPTDKPGRMLIVASGLALTAKFPNRHADPLIPSFDDGTGWGTQAAMERYSVTKTMDLMLLQKLGDLVDPNDVIITAIEPGLIAGSNLQRDVKGPMRIVFWLMKTLAARSLREAAWTYVDAVAVQPKESHGGFIINWKVHPWHTMMYEEDGKKVTEKLWKETLDELEFAGVREIMAAQRGKLSK